MFSGVCFPDSSKTFMVLTPTQPSWPYPGLCWWLQPMLLISAPPKVTDFSNLTLLRCSFV